MAAILTMPAGSTIRTVSQLELESIARMKRDIELAEVAVKDAEARVMGALQSGAMIEPGVRVAEIKLSERRNVSWKDVVIRLKGDGYVSQVLSHTKPDVSTRLVVR